MPSLQRNLHASSETHIGLRAALEAGADGGEHGSSTDASSLRHVVHVHRGNDDDAVVVLKRIDLTKKKER